MDKLLAVVVNVGPNNLPILENFLYHYCECLTDECKRSPLFINCDFTLDGNGSVCNVFGIYELVIKISEEYGITIKIVDDSKYFNRFGHDMIMDNFMMDHAGEFKYVLFTDDDNVFNQKGVVGMFRNMAKSQVVSCFGLVDNMGTRGQRGIGEWVCIPSIGSDFICVKVDDFYSMRSTFKRMYEGHFRKHQTPLNDGLKMFGETCCFYTMDLLKNEKRIHDITSFIGLYVNIGSQGSNKLNKAIGDSNYKNSLQSGKFFSKFGFDGEIFTDFINVDPWIKDIKLNELNGATAAYTFRSDSTVSYCFNEDQIESLCNSETDVFKIYYPNSNELFFRFLGTKNRILVIKGSKETIEDNLPNKIENVCFVYCPDMIGCNIVGFEFILFVNGRKKVHKYFQNTHVLNYNLA